MDRQEATCLGTLPGGIGKPGTVLRRCADAAQSDPQRCVRPGDTTGWLMTGIEFDYTEVLRSAESSEVSSIIASLELPNQPLHAVLWSVRHHDWVYAPGPAARILYDDERFDSLREIDRTTAERVARDTLHSELPSE